jgi:hypothetical protein
MYPPKVRSRARLLLFRTIPEIIRVERIAGRRVVVIGVEIIRLGGVGHVASMSRRVTETMKGPLKIQQNRAQHTRHENDPNGAGWNAVNADGIRV